MLTRIVHHSPKLCQWLDQLHLQLSQPQRQHILNLADGLLVCEDTKTLAALQRQFLDAPDPSNWADFLRISPWSATAVRDALRQNQVAWLLARVEELGLEKVLYINLDDSLGPKGKATARIEPVDWFHDHNESTATRPYYRKAFCYVECTLRAGSMTVTTDLRLYVRARTVRRLNRQRPAERRLRFHSKTRLAQAILAELAPLLPGDWQVVVQFDSWYASEKLIRFVRRHGWHVVCGLKSNRNFEKRPLNEWDHALRHKRYTRVRVPAADGRPRTYWVRRLIGHLRGLTETVCVYLSKRHPWERSRAYFLSTDVTRRAHQALLGYGGRWSCEVANFYLKTQLGLADFRVRSYEAVDKYVVAVLLTWAYVEWRFEMEWSAPGAIHSYGDIIRRHRDEQARDWLQEALRMVLATGSVEQVVNRFVGQPA
jgi:hypothetical protein